MSRCRFRYEDLPDRLRMQVDAMTRPAVAAEPPPSPGHPRAGRKPRGPNKTEARYRAETIDLRTDVAAVHYEGLTFRMANGHRYTPDWVVVTTAGRIECHEVKGGYALQSQQRARLAFDQVRVEFPWLGWVWAVKTPGGWQIEGRGSAGNG